MREEETASARSIMRANGSVSMREPESSSLARASWASATALAHEGLRRSS